MENGKQEMGMSTCVGQMPAYMKWVVGVIKFGVEVGEEARDGEMKGGDMTGEE